MTGILLCWLTRFMFEREQRAILQWPFMPWEKYTSLLVRLMKALSCHPPHPKPPHPTPNPPTPPTTTSGSAWRWIVWGPMCRSEVFVLFERIREQSAALVCASLCSRVNFGEPTLSSYAPPPPPRAPLSFVIKVTIYPPPPSPPSLKDGH